MILIASQRSGARDLADHLMNDIENDHIELAELTGFMSDDLHGALDEACAISKATQCHKFLFSVSLNPPSDAVVSKEEFQDTADRIAEHLGIPDQPRALVIHEKQGRRHAHVVFSRLDSEELKAIELGLFKAKLRDLSRNLFLEHGWRLPKGLSLYGNKNPLNFTFAEWQQAQRIGVDPREIKQAFQDAWAQSDDLKSLSNALEGKGLFLAKGDRRGFVALDIEGNIYALAKWTGLKAKNVKERLGSPDALPSTEDVRVKLRGERTTQLRGYIAQVKARQSQEMQPFFAERAAMVQAQRVERAHLKAKQDERWTRETKARSDRLNGGLRGLFDRLTGAHQKTILQNEREALAATHRDQEQRNTLILAQMTERKELQSRALKMRRKHKQDRKILARQIASALQSLSRDNHLNRRSLRRSLKQPDLQR